MLGKARAKRERKANASRSIFTRDFVLIKARTRTSEGTYISMWLSERVCATRSKIKDRSKNWGRSSAGRAPALHAGGQEFDPPRLHQFRGF
ncbi:hypothetical protein Lgra_2867 [Legionella gratiana]|uniref:Integrase n=1 Tax=Legionella gratiana TaxID=45066 RepID=A0ABR5R2A6_9GAMM|nr:hypothetical protein Lgra_2867 [Legionella gratiana]